MSDFMETSPGAEETITATPQELGAKLKSIAETKSLNQQELAEYIITHPPTIIIDEKKYHPGKISKEYPEKDSQEYEYAHKEIILPTTIPTDYHEGVTILIEETQKYLDLPIVTDEFVDHKERTAWEKAVSTSLKEIDKSYSEAFKKSWDGKLSANKIDNNIGGLLQTLEFALEYEPDSSFKNKVQELQKRYQQLRGFGEYETGSIKNTTPETIEAAVQIAIDTLKVLEAG